MSAWINSSQVSVTTGATTVTVSDGVSMESVISGDALMIAGQLPARCLSGTAPAGGVSTITLASPWDGPNITNAKAVVMPSAALLRQVATEVAQQNASYSSWWSVMEDWQYAMGTVTVDGPAGPREIPTYPQLSSAAQAAIGSVDGLAAVGITASAAVQLPFIADANAIKANGWYLVAAGTVGAPEQYGVLHYCGSAVYAAGNAVWGKQIFYATSGKVYHRSNVTPGTFAGAPWRELYDSSAEDSAAWVTPTLQNGWASAVDPDGVRCTRRAGIVTITGTMIGGSFSGASTDHAFVLPAGFRPRSNSVVYAYTPAAGAFPIVVKADGGVYGLAALSGQGVSFNISYAAGG